MSPGPGRCHTAQSSSASVPQLPQPALPRAPLHDERSLRSEKRQPERSPPATTRESPRSAQPNKQNNRQRLLTGAVLPSTRTNRPQRGQRLGSVCAFSSLCTTRLHAQLSQGAASFQPRSCLPPEPRRPATLPYLPAPAIPASSAAFAISPHHHPRHFHHLHLQSHSDCTGRDSRSCL